MLVCLEEDWQEVAQRVGCWSNQIRAWVERGWVECCCSQKPGIKGRKSLFLKIGMRQGKFPATAALQHTSITVICLSGFTYEVLRRDVWCRLRRYCEQSQFWGKEKHPSPLCGNHARQWRFYGAFNRATTLLCSCVPCCRSQHPLSLHFWF